MLDQITTDASTIYSQAITCPPDGISLDITDDQAIQEQTRYIVHLPIFEGPLDLLLHLIEKRQMEITTISLMAVTDQYLAYLQQWQEMSGRPQGSLLHNDDGSLKVEATFAVSRMANMAAFVSIAARLLFIKSQSLLPHSSK